MTKYLVLCLALMLPSLALAAQVNVTIPDAAVADLQQACQKMAVIEGKKIPSNSECGARLIRMGANALVEDIVRAQARNTAKDAVNAKRAELATNFPDPLTDAVCGDSEIDSHVGEECDDGNQTPGDGCDGACLIE